MSGLRLSTGDLEVNDTIFAVFRPVISQTLFHLIFLSNVPRYIASPPFHRLRNSLQKFKQHEVGKVNGEVGMA